MTSAHWRRLPLAGIVILLVGALMLATCGIIDPTGRWRPWTALFAPDEDGSWMVISIDGEPVPHGEYRYGITDGKISGGRDGCNDWGYTDDPPGPDGERMIVSTLQACPEDNPLTRAYRLLTRDPRMVLAPNGLLHLSGHGHKAVLRRCEWTMVSTPTSEVRTCVVPQ